MLVTIDLIRGVINGKAAKAAALPKFSDMLTLSRSGPGGAHYPHPVVLRAPTGFSDLATALRHGTSINVLIYQNHCDLIKLSCTLLHDWNAFLAAWTAVSTSFVPETGTFANSLPLLGSISLMTPAEVSTGDTRWLLIQLYGPDTLRKVVDIFLMKVWLKWRK